MRLIVQVLPLGMGPANSLAVRGRVPLATQKPDRFTIPVSPDHTFEHIWGLVEDRYKRNYLTPAQAANFTIKKIQDAYNCDLDLGDTVGAIFEGERDQEKIMIQVIQAMIDRDISVLPTSNLRPKSAQKRLLEVQSSSVNKRRRVEEQRYGTPLENLHPDMPILSSERDGQAGQTEELTNGDSHQTSAGGRKSGSASSVVFVQDSQADSGNPFFADAPKSESPHPEAIPLQSIPQSSLEDPDIPFPRTNGTGATTLRTPFLKPSLPASALRHNPSNSGHQAPLSGQTGESTLLEDDIEDINDGDGNYDFAQDLEIESRETQRQGAPQLPANPHSSQASPPEVLERDSLPMLSRERLDRANFYDRILSPDEERLFGAYNKRIKTYARPFGNSSNNLQQTNQHTLSSARIRVRDATKSLPDTGTQKRGSMARHAEVHSSQKSPTGPSISVSKLVNLVEEKQRRRSTDEGQSSPENLRAAIAKGSVAHPASASNQPKANTPEKPSSLKRPSKTSYNMTTPVSKQLAVGDKSLNRRQKEIVEQTKAEKEAKEEADKRKSAVVLKKMETLDAERKLEESRLRRHEDEERSQSREASSQASQQSANKSLTGKDRVVFSRQVRKTCDRCYLSKAKCDGAQPCSQCRKLDYECINTSTSTSTPSNPPRTLATPSRPAAMQQTTIPYPRDKGKGKAIESSLPESRLAKQANTVSSGSESEYTEKFSNKTIKPTLASSKTVRNKRKAHTPRSKQTVIESNQSTDRSNEGSPKAASPKTTSNTRSLHTQGIEAAVDSNTSASRQEPEELVAGIDESEFNVQTTKAGPSRTSRSQKGVPEHLGEQKTPRENLKPSAAPAPTTSTSAQNGTIQSLKKLDKGSSLVTPAKRGGTDSSERALSIQSSARRSVSFHADLETSEKPSHTGAKPPSSLGILKNGPGKNRAPTTPISILTSGMSSQELPGTTPSRASKPDTKPAPSPTDPSRTPSEETPIKRRRLSHIAIPTIRHPDVRAQQERIRARQKSASLNEEARAISATTKKPSEETQSAPSQSIPVKKGSTPRNTTNVTPATKEKEIDTTPNETVSTSEPEIPVIKTPAASQEGLAEPAQVKGKKPSTSTEKNPAPPQQIDRELVRPSHARNRSSEERQIELEIQAAESRHLAAKIPRATTIQMSDDSNSDESDAEHDSEAPDAEKSEDIEMTDTPGESHELSEPNAVPSTASQEPDPDESDELDGIKTPAREGPKEVTQAAATGAQESDSSNTSSNDDSDSQSDDEDEDEGEEESTKAIKASPQPARQPARFVSHSSSPASSSEASDSDSDSDADSTSGDEKPKDPTADSSSSVPEDVEMPDADADAASIPPSSPPALPTKPTPTTSRAHSSTPSSSSASDTSDSDSGSSPTPPRAASTNPKLKPQAKATPRPSSSELGSPSRTLPAKRATTTVARPTTAVAKPIPRPPPRSRVSAPSFPSISQQLIQVRAAPKQVVKGFDPKSGSLSRIGKGVLGKGKEEESSESESESSEESSSESSSDEEAVTQKPKPGFFGRLLSLNQ